VAKKKKKPLREPDAVAVKRPPAVTASRLTRQQLLVIGGILLVTFICFFPALSKDKQFTNWDDPVYVVNYEDFSHPVVQPVIEKLDAAHLKTMFSIDHAVSLNYHPLTMLSLAINFSISRLNPTGYFLTNIFLHLFNTLFVFIFLYRLSGKKFWVGAVSALLFGIHPMHVESVAWASERKDVLYCFFFLASCITYLRYLDKKEVRFLMYCFVLFLLSCLSKAMAIPLPLILLLIDFYKERKIGLRAIGEKVPFFALMLLFGLLAVHIQSKEAIADFQVFTLPQRFMFAAYGFMMYWVKLFVPYKLAAFYNYPSLDGITLVYQLAPLVTLLLVAAPAVYFYRRNKARFRLWVFGMGFFIAMVSMVLQFISVGAAIMADRYSYLPYIGAFFIIAMLLNDGMEKRQSYTAGLGLVSAAGIIFAVLCFNRVKVWQNSETLWSDVIEKYPYEMVQEGNVMHITKLGVDNAYKNRGNYYRSRNQPGDMEKAFADYEIMVKAHTKDVGAYTNMGNFYGLKGQTALGKGDKAEAEKMFTKALEMYSEAIRLKGNNFETVMNRGITYSMMGDHTRALSDFQAALGINPSAVNLYGNIAFEKVQLGMFAESIADANKVVQALPNDANGYYYRGTAYVNTGQVNEAINDLVRATQLNPKFSGAWMNLSIAYQKSGNKALALQAALNAKNNGYAVSDAYLNSLK
jgi:tetratricopeptide (TPR) repeat protein